MVNSKVTLIPSWVETANCANNPFPLNNLPCGVFSTRNQASACGMAIGDMIINVKALEDRGLISFGGARYFQQNSWNKFMSQGASTWASLRAQMRALLALEGDNTLCENSDLQAEVMTPISQATLHLPIQVMEFTDFYAGRHHAQNVGTMFRGAENALPPNWLHMPIGYNGRASSVIVSGTDVHRPWGQLKGLNDDAPRLAPCERFDFELEMGAIVGISSNRPVSVSEADDMIFGYVLLNDWSARDVQTWEYQPLGPFQSKAAATSISPWIIMKEALEPFRVSTPKREKPLLDYLQEPSAMLYDIDLEISLQAEGTKEYIISQTNYKEMYYSAAQQLAHHSLSGCPMRCADLIGSGTISGKRRENCGSMLELSWGGEEPLMLEKGLSRCFLEDGDTVTLRGSARCEGYTIGFGACSATVLAALKNPYAD